jgi:DNA-binding LacI/PurR family transcriptional regulator
MNRAFDDTLLNRDFFDRYCCKRYPADAHREWEEWIADNADYEDQTKVLKLLQIAGAVSETAARAFLGLRYSGLRYKTWDRLKRITDFVGWLKTIPRPEPACPDGYPPKLTKLVLLTELQAVPSIRYHHGVIRSLADACHKRRILFSLHEVRAGTLSADIEEVDLNYEPDAAVLLRLNPDQAAAEKLEGIPSFLIHADRRRYALPVVGNVVADHTHVPREIRAWMEDKAIPRRAEVVVASMPMEPDARAIRNDRIRKVLEGLEPWRPRHLTIENYSFDRALQVYRAYPQARVYVTLCEQVAVALKQLLEVSGRRPGSYDLVGFDNGQLAVENGLTTFDQQIPAIGDRVVETLQAFFTATDRARWDCRELPLEVHLVRRDPGLDRDPSLARAI